MPQERPKIGLLAEPSQALFPRNPSDTKDGNHDLEDPVFAVRNGVRAWLRGTIRRKRDKLNIITTATGENLFDHIVEGVHFAHLMDIADRSANGLRINLAFDNRHPDFNHKSQFGLMINYGYNNPILADHGHPHLRRVERFVEAMLLNIGDLRHSQSVQQFIDPLLLYTNFHDLAQIYNLQHNLTYPKEEITNVKKAHGLEAAIMLLAMHKRYAIERKVTVHDAWKKTAQAAAIIMIHDSPGKFMEILNSDITAADFVAGLSPEEKIKKLAEIFNKDNKEAICNVTTITPSNLLKTLALLKGKTEDDKSYGLPKKFLQEYEEEINALAGNNLPLLYENSSDTAGIPEGDKDAFKLAAEVALMADLIDMRIPGEESIFRTLRTHKSRNRRFFPTENFQYDQVKNLIFEGSGDIAADNPSFSDVVRILWESVNIEKLISGLPENNPLLKSRYLKNIIKDASIMSVLSLQAIGNRLLTRDFNVVDEVFKRRQQALVKKTERRTGLRLAHLDSDGLQALLNDDETSDIRTRLNEETSNLDNEAKEIKNNLDNKIPSIYEKGQINAFNELINQVLAELFTRYQVSHREETKYRKLVAAHRPLKSLPYRSYESLGEFPPKTLVVPIGIMTIAFMKALLDQEAEG